jgi:hypothetical protein
MPQLLVSFAGKAVPMKDMRIITQRDVILSVRATWLNQYRASPPEREIGTRSNSETVGAITKRLKALNLKTCTVEEVDKAIGTTGWADNECDVCSKSHEKLLRIGDEPDHDARWIDICESCLDRAALVLQERGAPSK